MKSPFRFGLVALTELGNVFGVLDGRRSYFYLCGRRVLPCMYLKLCFYVIGMLGNGGEWQLCGSLRISVTSLT